MSCAALPGFINQSSKPFFVSLILTISLIGICGRVAAQDSGSADEHNGVSSRQQAVALDTVEIRAHYDNGIGTSDAASQGIVQGKVIQDIPLLRPGETIETVPGMVVTQHSGDGKANQYFLRGYNLDHGIDFSTSIDGVPTNMPTNAHGQGYSDLNYLIPELIQRINYRKGPYFAETGDFSSAGSADIEYKKKLDRDLADFTFGADGYRRLLFAGSSNIISTDHSTGPTVLGALELLRNDGPWSTPEDLRKTNAIIRLSDGDTARGWSVDGVFYDAEWNATDQVPLELISSGRLGRFSAVDPYDGGKSGRYILSGNWHDTDEAGYLHMSAYMQHYSLKLWSNFTLYENDAVRGDQMQQAENRNVFGIESAKGWNHQLLGADSTTEAGLQIRHDNVNVSLKSSEARVTYQTITNDNAGQTALGIYLSNNTQWLAWLRTTVGVRSEFESMELNSKVAPVNNGSAHGSKLLPKFSAVLGPWAKTEIFANAGEGFHSNDARGVINKFDPAGVATTASPVLVSSFGKEIGIRTESIKHLQSSVAVWSLSNDSEILYSADAGATVAHGPSDRYGIEWNNHWVPEYWLLFDADIAWSHSRFAKSNDGGIPGNLIPNAVSKVGILRATIQDIGPWSAGWETRYISGYPLTQDGSLRAPSAIVSNLRIQREITKTAALSLDILNVFDRNYYDIAYAQDYRIAPGSAVVPSGITVHPGEPRQLRATLRLQF